LVKFGGQINDVKISKNEKFILIVGEKNEPQIHYFDEMVTKVCKEGHSSGIRSCVISPDNSFFATSGKDGTTIVYNSENLEVEKKIKNSSEIKSELVSNQADFWKNGNLILPGKENFQILKKNDGKWKFEILEIKSKSVLKIVKWVSENIVLGVDLDNVVSLYDIKKLRCLKTFELSEEVVQVEMNYEKNSAFLSTDDGNFGVLEFGDLNSETGIVENEGKDEVLDILGEEEALDEMMNEMILEQEELQKNEKNEKKEKMNFDEFRDTECDVEDNVGGELDVSVLAPVKESKKDEERDFHQKYKEKQKIEEEKPIERISPRKRANKMLLDDDDEIINQIGQEEVLKEEIEKEREANVFNFNKKFRSGKSQNLGGLVKINPQYPFNVNSTSLDGTRNYLTWNWSGTVVSRKSVEMDFLDINYSLSELAQKPVPVIKYTKMNTKTIC